MNEAVPSRDERRRRLWFLRAAIFCQLCGIGVSFAFATVWMKDQGLGEFLIGKVSALSTGLVLVAGLGWGMLADRTGRPGLIAVGGSIVMAAAMLVLAYSSRPAQFFAYAVVRGLSYPMVWNMMPLLAVSVMPEGSVGRGYGLYRIFGSVGYIVATFVLPRLVPGIQALLILAAGMLLLGALPLLSCCGRLPRRRHHEGAASLLRNRELLALFAAVFFFAFASPAIYAFMPVYARELGADNRFIGLLLSANGFIALVALPVSGLIVDRFGSRRMLWLALLAQPIRVVALSFVTRYEWLLAPQLLHFFTWAGFEVAAVLFITRLAGPGRSATAFSVYTGIQVLGGTLGVTAAGYLAERLGYVVMFRAGALAAGVGLLIFTAVLLGHAQQPTRGPQGDS